MVNDNKNIVTDLSENQTEVEAVQNNTDSQLNTENTPDTDKKAAPKKPRAPRKTVAKKTDGIEEAAGAQTPKKPRAPRKKSVTATTEEQEGLSSENTLDVLENPTQSSEETTPLFDILNGSSDESEDESEIDEQSSLFPDADVISDEEKITPPDELFADLHKKDGAAVSNEEISEKSEELSEELKEDLEELEEASDESDIQPDSIIDEDGQYTLSDIEPMPEQQKVKETPEYNPQKPRRVDVRFDFIELFVFTLVAVMIITTFFFRPSIVKGESMENTLHDGEHLIISDFFYTPKRGDIIVCDDRSTKITTPIVKRVIALGGDSIKITPNAIYVNGILQDERDYVYIGRPNYRYEPLEMVVPDGELFVMGDHRDNSTDSRDSVKLGTVSEDSVLGKVLIRIYPFNKFGTVD